MRKALLFFLVCCASVMWAQSTKTGTITGSGCLSMPVGNSGQVSFVVTGGSWSGTIQPQVQINGQTASNTVVYPATAPTTSQGTVTANGTYTTGIAGYDVFQLCGNTVTNTATVTINRVQQVARIGGGSGSGTISPSTTGYIPMYTAASTLGASNPLLDDGITSPNVLTYAGSGGDSAASFNTTGSNGGISGTEGTGGSLTAGAATDLLYPDSTSHCWHQNLNNTDYGCVPFTLESGTVTVTGDAPLSGACASEHTLSITGLLTTDIVEIGFNGDPSGVTGIAPTTNGGVYILAYPKSAGTAGFKVCNDTSATITVGTLVLNVKVRR